MASFDEFAALRGRDYSSRPNRKTTSYYAMGAEESKLEPPEEPMAAALRKRGAEKKRKLEVEGRKGTPPKRLKPTAVDDQKAASKLNGGGKSKTNAAKTTRASKTKSAPTNVPKATKSTCPKTTRRGTAKTPIRPPQTPPPQASPEPAIPETPEGRQASASVFVDGENTSGLSETSSQTLVAEPKEPALNEIGNLEIAESVVEDVEAGTIRRDSPDGYREETDEAVPTMNGIEAVSSVNLPVTQSSTTPMNVDITGPVSAADPSTTGNSATTIDANTVQTPQAHSTTAHEARRKSQGLSSAEADERSISQHDLGAELTHTATTTATTSPANEDYMGVSAQSVFSEIPQSSSLQANEESMRDASTDRAQDARSNMLVLKIGKEALSTVPSVSQQSTLPIAPQEHDQTNEPALVTTGRPKRQKKVPVRFTGLVETPAALESSSTEKDTSTVPVAITTVNETSETPTRPLKRARKETLSEPSPATAAKAPRKARRTGVPAEATNSNKTTPQARQARRASIAASRRPSNKKANTKASAETPSDTETVSSPEAGEEADYVEATDVDTPPRKKPARRNTITPKARHPRPQTPSTVTRRPVKSKQAVTPALPTPPCSQLGENSLLDSVDPEVLALSRALTHRQPVGSKPLPVGKPEVWAHSRQALCETVPYFKKPQGGCHSNDGHVYTFLFDGVGHCREFMDPEIIISRAGGGMEQDSTGSMLQGKDQSMLEAQVLGMLNDIQLQNPLIVICGNKNSGALCEMPHKYSVLGWYKPIMVWAEKTAGKGKKSWVTIKYRMEWMTSQGQPWHTPKDTTLPERSSGNPALRQACQHCQQTFPQIYLEGWLCLNADCGNFWTLPNGEDAPTGKLAYNPAFLHERTSWPCEEVPYAIRPPLPDFGKTIGDDRLYNITRGVVCPECGRCNQRYLWKGWRCDNPACTWQGLLSRQDPIMPASLHNPWESVGDGPSLGRNKHLPEVQVDIRYAFGYKVYIYTFTGVDGRFVHAVANRQITAEPRGPDDMLREVQLADMGLERRRFGTEKMSGDKEEPSSQSFEVPKTPPRNDANHLQLLTPASETPTTLETTPQDTLNEPQQACQKPIVPDGDFMTAFSMNYGMPYKFVASGGSQPFDNAPWPVRACRSRLNWAAKEFLQDVPADADFNEELIFAYMEGQKIEYHDDGEEGLGPRIATLSLGGKAQMFLRMKAKHYNGCSKTGVLMTERPLPGSTEYDRRTELLPELEKLKDTDKAAYKRRLKELPKELGLYEKRNKAAPDLVTVTLNHGDIVLMDGYEIQKFLEHKVVPAKCLRFALTCRTVLENHLKEHEKPSYEVKPDDTPYQPTMARSMVSV